MRLNVKDKKVSADGRFPLAKPRKNLKTSDREKRDKKVQAFAGCVFATYRCCIKC